MEEQEKEKERKWLPWSYNGGCPLVAGRGLQFHKDTQEGWDGGSGVGNALFLELFGGYTEIQSFTFC